MAYFGGKRLHKSVQFWILVGYLTLVFLLGGGARSDIQSLIILRPAAVLICAFALFTFTREHIRPYRFLFGFSMGLFFLVALQLIPLPPWVWQSLPGREIITEIDKTAQLGDVWRPISIVPLASWNALYSLFVPLGVLLLGVQLNQDEQSQLLPFIISLGLLSGMLGLLQIVGAREGPLYFYRISNNGSAVGLFANRNHQAVLLACLFPMLAVYAFTGTGAPEQARVRAAMAIVVSLVLVPLLLVTGSRAGLVVGILGVLSIPLLYTRLEISSATKRRCQLPPAAVASGALGIIGLTLLANLFGRAKAYDRIVALDMLEDARFKVWGPIMRMAWQYFPFGSGVGTFSDGYKIGELDRFLAFAYLNHAHNDWLEIYMTGGAFACLLLVTAIIAWGVCSLRVWRDGASGTHETSYGRLASVLIGMLGVASVVDYPLRVPSMMCSMTVFAIWLARGGRQHAPTSGTGSVETCGNSGDPRLAQRKD